MEKDVRKKTIALVAHNNKKLDLAAWVSKNREFFRDYNLIGTQGTARAINEISGLEVKEFMHGPDGGDIKIAGEVLDDKIDLLVFIIDVVSPHGHEHDVQTLIRISVLKNIPLALNIKTADYFLRAEKI